MRPTAWAGGARPSAAGGPGHHGRTPGGADRMQEASAAGRQHRTGEAGRAAAGSSRPAYRKIAANQQEVKEKKARAHAEGSII